MGTAEVRRPHKAVLKPISLCGYCRSSKNAQSCSQPMSLRGYCRSSKTPTNLFSSRYPSVGTAEVRRTYKAVLNRCPSVGTAEVRRPHKAVLKPISLCGYCRSSKNAQSCSQPMSLRGYCRSSKTPTNLFSSRYPSVGTAEVRRTYKAVLKPMSGSCWCGVLQKFIKKPTTRIHTERSIITRSSASVGR